ncbi:MAG: Tetratricopeptide (TPR) repeat [Chloroflexi bacterium AL-W]|nr:Tetratricopeptide (TPR) repeat [Chloroflexi bacterium AL-N1]NOK65462.1 Tetratricopeptide (TPR) repeat [Chloroflexi bacterium AL-N10]NOK72272.1 Tetratricopeptide (TPR) repeat [Chloroflexi bacterium AL-N5]NOK79642.1 Tetratricopeptide (TPR) repeat [Chloroflexi bacterium AL-W]NOK87557.1 Tetratricopeptide (TPR) repeat [Chloroflexi bacterium AL-N15]
MEEDGPWAGLNSFLRAIFPQIATEVPQIIQHHAYELAMVLPELRATIEVQNPTLTDLSSDTERTRNWPADRAYRIVHGLIDLIDTWAELNNGIRLVIACDDFHHAGALVRLFFVELLRRRGKQHAMTLIVATDAPQSIDIQQQFATEAIAHIIRADLPADESVTPDPIEMQQAAEALMSEVGNDAIKLEMYVPRIIRYWLASNTPEKALPYQVEALSIYNTRGMYADAVVYGEAAMEQTKQHHPDDIHKIFHISIKLCTSYFGLRHSHKAFPLINEALERSTAPGYKVPFTYYMAMLYARYLPERDLTKAEEYLDMGLTAIEQTDLPAHEKFFQTAFNRNGLALLRHFQQRYDEAIGLCKTCIEKLDRHLSPDEHKLHRSVLLYNIAQVYVAMEHYDEAITYYTSAMEMDPNYSEYYNERGNIYLTREQYDLAVADYTTAIALSPPYAEVWTNIGQCYRLMGQLQDAVAAYSMALDLEPQQSLALFGRAEAWEALQQEDAARNDYDTLLTIDPTHVQALTRKAIYAYEDGNLSMALQTLNAALEHHTDVTELYWNRATVFKDLGRFAEAARDITSYLDSSLDADDRAEAEAKLAFLEAQTTSRMELHA